MEDTNHPDDEADNGGNIADESGDLKIHNTADGSFIKKLSGKNLPVSSIRVKKFASLTEFNSSKAGLENFQAPFSLNDGVHRTLQSEFINPDPNREIFFTE